MVAELINRRHRKFGLMLTKDMTVGNIIKSLKPLLKYTLHKKLFELFIKELGEISGLIKQRNRYVHSVWYPKDWSGEGKRVKLDMDEYVLTLDEEPIANVSPDRLKDLADKLEKATLNMSHLLMLLITAPRPYPFKKLLPTPTKKKNPAGSN